LYQTPALPGLSIWTFPPQMRHDSRYAVWDPECGRECFTELQRAARAFLLRLVAENGIEGAARVLR